MRDRARAVVASLGLVAIAVAWIFVAPVTLEGPTLRRALMAVGAIACAIGPHTRSLTLHVAARGFAWVSMALGVFVATAPLAHARVFGSIFACAGALAIVALGRGSYGEAAATSGFAPSAYRGWFLGSATAASASLWPLAVTCAFFAWQGDVAAALLIGGLALGVLGSLVLVLRMRAAGVLLGIATAMAAFAGALTYGAWSGRVESVQAVGTISVLVVVVALSFSVPVVLARLERASST